jgi:hypothetical protein
MLLQIKLKDPHHKAHEKTRSSLYVNHQSDTQRSAEPVSEIRNCLIRVNLFKNSSAGPLETTGAIVSPGG